MKSNNKRCQWHCSPVKDGFKQNVWFLFWTWFKKKKKKNLLSIKYNCLRVRLDLKLSWFPFSDWVYPPQGSAKVCSHGRGGRVSSSGSAVKGQSESLGRSRCGVRRSVCGQFKVCAPGRHGPFRTQCVWARLNPRPVPEPGSCSRTWYGILRSLVLLLHLWLRVHKQRTFDGAHEGSRGRHHQYHPEQGAAADWSSGSRTPVSRVRPLTCFRDASVAFRCQPIS